MFPAFLLISEVLSVSCRNTSTDASSLEKRLQEAVSCPTGCPPPTREAGWRPEAGRPQVQARPGGKLWARGSGGGGPADRQCYPIFTCRGKAKPSWGSAPHSQHPHRLQGAPGHTAVLTLWGSGGSLTLCSYLLCAFDPFVSLPECPLFSAWLTPG